MAKKMEFEIYKTKLTRQWRWRLKAANSQIIASGEGYKNRSDCVHAVELVKGSNDATIVYKD